MSAQDGHNRHHSHNNDELPEAVEGQDLQRQTIVYDLPGTQQVKVRKDLTYKTIEDVELKLDIYYPEHQPRSGKLPAVLLIHGDGPAVRLSNIKEGGQYQGWGRLIAASGIIAVVAQHRSSEGLHNVVGVANDIDDLVSYVRDAGKELHIDAEKLGIWTSSSGGPFALRAALHETPPYVRCIVGYYCLPELKTYYQGLYREAPQVDDEGEMRPLFSEEDFDEFSASELLLRRPGEVAPIFIARAGLDYADLNEALDCFIAEAIAQNVELTLMNHPTGQHAFDILDDQPRSYEIISATLDFLETHLLPV